MKEYMDITNNMLEFIEKSPTCFHAIRNIQQELERAGFDELTENAEWKLTHGRSYYVTRNDSSLIAFRLPEAQDIQGFHMVATHIDSPSFKVKENPEMMVEDNYIKLNTEKYGGMILSTWLDRALSVAGRVAVEEGKGIVTKLVNIDKDLLVIPNMAIHMNRDMNKGVEYNPQVDMLPLFAGSTESQGKGALLQQIATAAGVEPEAVLGYDLFLYPREKGRIFGENGEFVLSPRLDDLQCVFAAVSAFVESIPKKYINVCAVFDNEEVGSGTRQGADSTFLEDTLQRIGEALEVDGSDYLRWIAGSFLISADNAHAVHPNHPEKADPTNRPYLNSGIVIKYHGSQKYTTDAVSAATMKSICRKAGVPWQTYANRSDIAGGSTLGNISTAHVSVASVDIGLPQLAMHSAVETAGTRDTEYAVKAMKVFWQE
ncbi:MAG: M18 family aminopeptidase [Lachnospiraceae bacterium]|nr:M18 family aminopeptidase [Lachnospiraceae bacterium]